MNLNNSTPTWKQDLTRYLKVKGKLTHLGALTAIEDLQAKQADNQKNVEAESAAVRRSLWGSDESVGTKSDEEMRTTILGDVTHPTPIVMPTQPNNIWPTAALVLATMLPMAGIGAAGIGAAITYYLSQPAATAPPAQSPGYTDSTATIRLGRLNDLLKQE